jgi:hypothetical protein
MLCNTIAMLHGDNRKNVDAAGNERLERNGV